MVEKRKLAATYRSSRPTESVLPRPHRDASQRFSTYGRVQPMDDQPTDTTPTLSRIGLAVVLIVFPAMWFVEGWLW